MAELATHMEHWKVTMLGDGGVGKTALAVQFTQRQFIETYDPTIEDSYRKQVIVDDKMAFLEIIDTAGQEDYSTLRDQWIREAQGIILVYSLTNKNSFDNIEKFRRTMLSLHSEPPVFLLIGNKADDAYKREVYREEALTYARRHGGDFFEASAKTGQNVEKLFSEIVRQLRAKYNGPPATPGSTTTSARGSLQTRTSAGTATTGITAPPSVASGSRSSLPRSPLPPVEPSWLPATGPAPRSPGTSQAPVAATTRPHASTLPSSSSFAAKLAAGGSVPSRRGSANGNVGTVSLDQTPITVGPPPPPSKKTAQQKPAKPQKPHKDKGGGMKCIIA